MYLFKMNNKVLKTIVTVIADTYDEAKEKAAVALSIIKKNKKTFKEVLVLEEVSVLIEQE